MRTSRAYLAGFGTAGSLLAAAAVLFVLASAVVAFRGFPEVSASARSTQLEIPASGGNGAAVVVRPAPSTRVLLAFIGTRTRTGAPAIRPRTSVPSTEGTTPAVAPTPTVAAPSGSAPAGSTPAGAPAPTQTASTPTVTTPPVLGGAVGNAVEGVGSTVAGTVSATGANLNHAVAKTTGTLANSVSKLSQPLAKAVTTLSNTVTTVVNHTTSGLSSAVNNTTGTVGKLLGGK